MADRKRSVVSGNRRVLHSFYVSPLETDRTMPISPRSIIRLVPPEEKKGRLMPVFGMVLVTTAMLQNTCHAICAIMPMPTMVQN